MFDKILIANRGEIACRVIRTARRMGIRTVAVYSQADRRALHVSLADEAVEIGPPPSAESYLVIDRILQACRETRAEAVHPGYGFLSENAAFAQRLADEGITFIGPTVAAIRAMGDKLTSKNLAQAAGVPIIPGHPEILRDALHAVAVGRQIGYPVMLKASAGGGGRGMRLARTDDECRDGFQRAASEAHAAFGDGRVLIEKFIPQPRHIEIQVLADSHGQVIHLGERECSLQRRHQKVIEESPSPLVDPPWRATMGERAAALARAVNYQSAGTVEFLVDADRNFYFLEMNTRLQVEHPVTEFVTGLDLVELMIRIAAGERLPFTQADVQYNGWAIEARVYAEDPLRHFLPSPGRLVRFLPPAESEFVRVDTGVSEGGEVSLYYDPLVAKVIAHGETRQRAIDHLQRALSEFCIRGVSNNIGFLAALIDHSRFRTGRLSTQLIADEFPDGFRPIDIAPADPALLLAIVATVHRRYVDRAARISGQLPGYERTVQDAWIAVVGPQRYPIQVVPLQDAGHCVTFGGERYHVHSDWQFGQPRFKGTINGTEICAEVQRQGIQYRLSHRGVELDFLVLTERAAELLDCMPKQRPVVAARQLLAPMPGLLAQLFVREGHEVKAGQDLAIVEAMKMENMLRANHDAKVLRILAAVGDTLAVDQPILEFE
jgi:propionyl-CoA carboxylase alpha chain